MIRFRNLIKATVSLPVNIINLVFCKHCNKGGFIELALGCGRLGLMIGRNLRLSQIKWREVDRKLDRLADRVIKILLFLLLLPFRLALKLTWRLFKIVIEALVYPFRGLKNFLKSTFLILLLFYIFFSIYVMADYIGTHYSSFDQLFCYMGAREKIQSSVVRVVGGYSEGTGFFIAPDQVITNFHVIAYEPSPKIILADGKVVIPTKIVGDKDADLAVLFTKETFDSLVLPLPDRIYLSPDETLMSAGYPLGTDLKGNATVLKGQFIDFRKSQKDPVGYIQTDISLVEGMSGGPLVDQCGSVVGINTMSLAGLSLFINADWAKFIVPSFTDQNITKIEVDPKASPESAVNAFYVYLKARRMEEGFALLSEEYLQKTNFEEWTSRFTDILDVTVYKTVRYENSKDTAQVKFSTKNWVDGESEIHYYEGTWRTKLEDGVYKMVEAKIEEVQNPSWDWFYQ